MSEFNNDSKQYTASEIRQYLDGKMSAGEMHAIEKAALEDLFLADAIEGMHEAKKEFGNDKIEATLDQIHEQIAAKATGGKVVPISTFRWWRIAAAACVLIVSSVLVYNTWLKPELPTSIAVNDTKINAPETVSPASPGNSINREDSSKEDFVKSSAERKSPVISDEPEKQKLPGNNAPATATRPEENDRSAPVAGKGEEIKTSAKREVVKTDDNKKENIIENETAVSKQANEGEKAIPGNVSKDLVTVNDPGKNVKGKAAGVSSNVAPNYFNGRIIDNNNRPVPNATVQLANKKNGYLTDQDGYFKVASTDTLVEVSVSVVGYASQNFRLRNDLAINQLQLQPDNKSLDEVVVVTADQKKAKQKTDYKTKYPSVLVQDAEPARGWLEFDKYISTNKKTIINDSAKSGEVVVSFLVDRNAVLSKFKIEQSLSPAQDAEALRLIKEGPSWRLLKGKRTRALVIIRF